ncbi:hypothetical protein F4695_004533, partial [Rhizobium soli]|nr:hypothetical protein [Rhizobium soli]
SLPHLARRSITFDRGTEFTDWPYLQASIGTQTWFCDPQSPWQKGTVENTNRRARKWLSREVNPLSLSDRDLTEICSHLNATPRKCLGYKTPAEVFRQKLLAQIRRTSLLLPARKSRFTMNSHICDSGYRRHPAWPVAAADCWPDANGAAFNLCHP